jgi:NADP-dependent 3-hydroxy acid dehydrogenase YdfG
LEELKGNIHRDTVARPRNGFAVEPGMVETELFSHIGDASPRAVAGRLADSMRRPRAGDVAEAVLYAAGQPDHVAVNEILLRPTDQVQ